MTSEVEGQTGYLVLSLEGSVLSSGGDLESDQRYSSQDTSFLTVDMTDNTDIIISLARLLAY